MGCVCCSLSSFVSILLNALERISFCTICACFIYCMLFTIIAVLVLGIGVGFHYCIVRSTVEAMAKAGRAAGMLRTGPEGPVMRSVDTAAKRGTFGVDSGRERERRDVINPPPSNNSTAKINSTLNSTNFTKVENYSNTKAKGNFTRFLVI